MESPVRLGRPIIRGTNTLPLNGTSDFSDGGPIKIAMGGVIFTSRKISSRPRQSRRIQRMNFGGGFVVMLSGLVERVVFDCASLDMALPRMVLLWVLMCSFSEFPHEISLLSNHSLGFLLSKASD